MTYVLENITRAIGHETSLLAGLRLTLVTAPFGTTDTTLNVQSAANWDATGTLYVNGQKLTYTGRTATTFTGVAFVDTVAATAILTGALVGDGGRNYSAVDQVWQRLFVRTATGTDLDRIADKLGLVRPGTLSDALFRELIQAVAYGRRGTADCLWAALTAVYGASGFETLTVSPRDADRATTYVRLRNDYELTALGKTFLNDTYLAFIESGSTDLLNTGIDAVQDVISVRFIDDVAPRWVTNDSDVDVTVTAGVGSAEGTFINGSVQPYPGDEFHILNGPLAGQVWTIDSITPGVSDTITFGFVPHAAYKAVPSTLTATYTLPKGSWKITRPKSLLGYYVPEDDVRDSDYSPGKWTKVGTGDGVLFSSPVYGETTELNSTLNEVYWIYPIGVQYKADRLQAKVAVETSVSIVAFDGANSLELFMAIDDRAFWYGVGVLCNVTDAQIGFVDTAGAFVGTPFTVDISLSFPFRMRLEAEDAEVRLYVNGALVDSLPVEDFDLSQVIAPEPPRLEFGSRTTGMNCLFSDVQWSVVPHDRDDFWDITIDNAAFVGGQTIGDAGTTGAVTAACDGKMVRLWTDPAAYNGFEDAGTWLISLAVLDEITVVGAPQTHGEPLFSNPLYFKCECYQFRYPQSIGHTIVIDSGPDTGATRTITSVVDPIALQPVIGDILGTGCGYSSNVVLLDSALTPIGADDEKVRWHIVPDFVVNGSSAAINAFTIVDMGTRVGGDLTLATAVPFEPLSGTDPIQMEVRTTDVESAYLWWPGDVGDGHGFYLWDAVGWMREFLEGVVAAGITLDFESLWRSALYPGTDVEGLHLLG